MHEDAPAVGSTVNPVSNAPHLEADARASDSSESQSEDHGSTAPEPSSSSSSSSWEERQPPPPSVLNRVTWVSASMVGGLVVAFVLVLVLKAPPAAPQPTPRLAPPEEISQFAPDSGVGEAALEAAQDVPKAILPALLSLGRPMPSKPFPGQRRPPCERGEQEIRGLCWLGPMKGQEPPCGDRMFDHEGKCYFVSLESRPPAHLRDTMTEQQGVDVLGGPQRR